VTGRRKPRSLIQNNGEFIYVHKTVLVSGPSVEPITTAEAKTHLNVSGTSKDTYIDTLIVAARNQIERYLHRALISQRWKVYYDCWQREMLIPFGKLQVVGASPGPASPIVSYYNDAGASTVLTENDYYWVVTTTDPGRIVQKYNTTYPELQDGRPDAIEIAFTAGYGAAASAIPGDIKHAMKLLITNYFEHRGEVVVGERAAMKIPSYITDLIHSYKLYEF
jgi:uncharacterized phiE125 gp8 family phage protein